MKRILMTGGTGFLGSNLLAWLAASGYDIYLLKRTTSKLDRIQGLASQIQMLNVSDQPICQIFEKHKFDMIIHCATNYGRRPIPPTEIIEANLILPLNLLQQAEKFEVPVFINTDTSLDKRVSDYTLSKKHFVDWLKLFSDKLTCVNISLAHFYGPLDDRSKFVTKTIMDLLNSVDRLEFSPGRQKRDFIFIDDVVQAFARIIMFTDSAHRGFYHFDVGTGINTEIRKLVVLIKELTGNQKTQLEFGALPYRTHEVMEPNLWIEPLKALGWHADVALPDGLKITIDAERKAMLRTASKTAL